MRWFGEKPWSRACEESPRAEIPAGEPCQWCDEKIEPDADGVLVPAITGLYEPATGTFTPERRVQEKPLHAECFLRQLGGSYLHLRGLCGCGGNPARPTPELEADLARMTKRQEAIFACELFCNQTRKLADAMAAKGPN